MASSPFAAVASDSRASSPELEIMSREEYYAYVREVYDTLTEMIKDGKEREAARNKAKNTSPIVEQPKRTDVLPVSTVSQVSSLPPPNQTLMMKPVHRVAADLEMRKELPLGKNVEHLVGDQNQRTLDDINTMTSKTATEGRRSRVTERNYKFRKRRIWKEDGVTSVKHESKAYSANTKVMKRIYKCEKGSRKRNTTMSICLENYGMSCGSLSFGKYRSRFRKGQEWLSKDTLAEEIREGENHQRLEEVAEGIISIGETEDEIVGLIYDKGQKKLKEVDARAENVKKTMLATYPFSKVGREVFQHMPKKSLVAWNSMIKGFVAKGDSKSGIVPSNRMITEGTQPSQTTLTIILMACSQSLNLQHGEYIHDYAIKSLVDAGTFMYCSLVDLYFKSGEVKLAETIFPKTQKVVVESRNVTISGYVSVGNWFKATEMYDQMVNVGVNPNAATLISVLPACYQRGVLEKCKWIQLSISESRLHEMSSFMSLETYSERSIQDWLVKAVKATSDLAIITVQSEISFDAQDVRRSSVLIVYEVTETFQKLSKSWKFKFKGKYENNKLSWDKLGVATNPFKFLDSLDVNPTIVIYFTSFSSKFSPNEVLIAAGVNDVSGNLFKYDSATKAVMVSIVGLSGSGKSTVVNSLLQLYEPKSGHIIVDDTEIKTDDTEILVEDSIKVVDRIVVMDSGRVVERGNYKELMKQHDNTEKQGMKFGGNQAEKYYKRMFLMVILDNTQYVILILGWQLNEERLKYWLSLSGNSTTIGEAVHHGWNIPLSCRSQFQNLVLKFAGNEGMDNDFHLWWIVYNGHNEDGMRDLTERIVDYHLEDKVSFSGESKGIDRGLALVFISEMFHSVRPPEQRSSEMGSSLIMRIKILCICICWAECEGNLENEEAVFNTQRVHAKDMKNLATETTVKASRFYRELNAETVKNLLIVQTLLSEPSSLEARAEELEAASSNELGGDKSRIKKTEEWKPTIKVMKGFVVNQVGDVMSCYERVQFPLRSQVVKDNEREDCVVDAAILVVKEDMDEHLTSLESLTLNMNDTTLADKQEDEIGQYEVTHVTGFTFKTTGNNPADLQHIREATFLEFSCEEGYHLDIVILPIGVFQLPRPPELFLGNAFMFSGLQRRCVKLLLLLHLEDKVILLEGSIDRIHLMVSGPSFSIITKLLLKPISG